MFITLLGESSLGPPKTFGPKHLETCPCAFDPKILEGPLRVAFILYTTVDMRFFVFFLGVHYYHFEAWLLCVHTLLLSGSCTYSRHFGEFGTKNLLIHCADYFVG